MRTKQRKSRRRIPAPVGVGLLQVPVFPRLDEYVGVWGIEQRAAAALWEAAQRVDVGAHVRQAEQEPVRGAVQAEQVRASNGQTIAVIKATGVLMKQVPSMTAGTSTISLRREIRQATADPDVGGILIVADSPGGTVAGTADLGRDVRAAAKRKPVWLQVEDMCASAAYQAFACQVAKVFANSNDALVGSIGTMLVMYDLSGMAEQKGIRTLVFKTGAIKGAGIEGAKITEEQETYFQGLVDQLQKSFDQAVQKGRGLTDKQLADVRTGAVFVASDAQAKKLIDGIQPLETTLEQLAAEAKRFARAGAAERGNNIPAPVGGGLGRESTTMTFEQWLAAQGFDAATMGAEQLDALEELYERANQAAARTPTVNVEAELQAMRTRLAAETERVAGIRRICGEHGNPTMAGDNGAARVSVEARAIEQGWDLQRTEMAASLEELRAGRPQGPGIISRSQDRDCTLEALQGAMVLRFGGRLDAPAYQQQAAVALGLPGWMRQGINAEQRQRAMEWAHRFSHMSALDICKEACRLDGRDAPLERSALVQTAISGTSLTNIFTTSVNARLLATYLETSDTTMGWTSSVDVGDFKTQERPRLKKGGALPKLPRGGTADHATRADQAESYKIARYAQQFVVDEQDFIDDSLNAFQDMPSEMGRAALRLRPDLVYAILKANGALDADSVALFHSDHNNTDSSAALAAATLKAGVTRIGIQTENGVNLNLMVSHLVVPQTLQFTGRELLNSTAIIIAGTAGSVTERGTLNTLAQLGVQLVFDSRLDNGVTDPATGTTHAGDTNDWFLAAAGGHTIEVGYLRGTGRAPQVRSFVLDKGQWGLGWDIKHDIGAKALDFRSLYRGQG